MSIICTYLIIQTYILTNMFLVHFMAVADHSSYSLAHYCIDFLKKLEKFEKRKSLALTEQL